MLLEYRMRSVKSPLGLVFSNSEGNPVDPDNFVKRRFLPAVKGAGVGKVRFHDLRHNFGSLKIEQGENLKSSKFKWAIRTLESPWRFMATC